MSRTTAPEPFKSLIHEWERALRAENRSRRTIEGYALVAHLFHYWLSQTENPPSEPGNLTSGHFRGWIGHRVDTTSPANANNNYRALQQWCNFLLIEDEIDDHPMKTMKPPKIPDQDPPVIPWMPSVRFSTAAAVGASCRAATPH